MIRLRRRGRRGQTLVEFALILLPFLMIVIGLFDVGRAIYGYNTVANAARSAARVAIVNQDLVDVERTAVESAAALRLQWTPGVGSTDVVFTTCATQYCFITVTPLISEVFNPTISSTATMPVEVVNP
jgi:Flp pilus assembly protein TadG